jgi:hypothetical protein
VIPGVTDVAAAAAGAEGAAAAGATGAAAGAVGSGTASGGALASISSLLTNPITIGIGAAIGAALIWKSTQVHPVADTFVQKFQNPFGQHLGQIVDNFDQALASGQLTKEQATIAYQQTASLIQSFEQDRANFAKQGDKESTVAKQAERTMAQDFGGKQNADGSWSADYSKIMAKMKDEIAQLPSSGTGA